MLLDEPTPAQRALLSAIDAGRSASGTEAGVLGDWPKFGFVEWKLDSHDPSYDANEVVASLPFVTVPNNYCYSAVWSDNPNAPFLENDHIGLTLLGRSFVMNSPDGFIKLGNLASFRLLLPHEPQGTWQPIELAEPDVWGHWPVGRLLPRVREEVPGVLEHEPPTLGEGIWRNDVWSLRLTRRLRGFEGVETLQDYVSRIEALAPPPPAPERAVSSPLALPNALDYFNAVWRLRFGDTEGILELSSAEQTAMLALDAATSEEFLSRLLALRNVLGGLQVSGSESHALERLRGRLVSLLDPEDAAASGLAIDTLVTTIPLRNGLIHENRAMVREACMAIGIDWPIADYRAAWKRVQIACVEAFDTMRELIQSL